MAVTPEFEGSLGTSLGWQEGIPVLPSGFHQLCWSPVSLQPQIWVAPTARRLWPLMPRGPLYLYQA